MKHNIRNVLGAIAFLSIAILSLSGCYENHYYHQYHHHTRPWYDHHHMPPPSGVDFNVDVRR